MKLNIQLFADGEVTIGVQLDTKSFKPQIALLESKLEDLMSEYELALKDKKFPKQGIQEYEAEIQALINKIKELQERQRELDGGKGGLEDAKNSLGDIIKKVGKWTIAIFGVRSAYNFVRQSVSTISQYNKNLAKDIENIRYGLASAIAPIILKIVEWAYKLIQIVNYIWRKLFGKNLFSDIPKNLKSGNKEAKKLQKTLAGFDEMNVLNSQSSGGSSGGGSVGTPTHSLTGTDLISEETQEKIDNFTTKVKENKDAIKGLGIAFGVLFGLNILSKFTGLFGKGGLLKAIEPFTGKVVELARSGIDKLGVGLTTLAGKFGMVAGGSSAMVGGLALLDAVLIAKIVNDLKNEVIPAIKDTHKEMDDAKKGLNDTTKATKKLGDVTLDYARSVEAGDETLSRNIDFMMRKIQTTDKEIEAEKNQINVTGALTGENKVHKKAIEELDKQMWQNISTLGKLASQGKLTTEQAQSFVNTCQDEITKLEEKNAKLNENSKEYQNNKAKIEALKKQIDITKGNYDVKVKTDADKKPVDELKSAVDSVAKDHKGSLDFDTSKGKKSVGNFFKNLGQDITTTLGFSWSSLKKKFGFAKGGIINQPGRGVPLASAYGGEAGREGIIPLTDSQQMQLLGEAIGKYITLNTTIVNQMNGRVISRELQKIQGENDFAGNR